MALRPLFCLFFSGRLRQVSLYTFPQQASTIKVFNQYSVHMLSLVTDNS